MLRLVLIRHGDAYDDTGEQEPGSTLNSRGQEQVEALARRLKNAPPTAVYASPYQRAQETAREVNKSLGLEIKTVEGLKEVGTEEWPKPDTFCDPQVLKDFFKTQEYVERVFREIVGETGEGQVLIFTHGNWIRTLLSKILEGGPEAFVHFQISLASITVLEVDETGFVKILTVSDGAHTFYHEWD